MPFQTLDERADEAARVCIVVRHPEEMILSGRSCQQQIVVIDPAEPVAGPEDANAAIASEPRREDVERIVLLVPIGNQDLRRWVVDRFDVPRNDVDEWARAVQRNRHRDQGVLPAGMASVIARDAIGHFHCKHGDHRELPRID